MEQSGSNLTSPDVRFGKKEAVTQELAYQTDRRSRRISITESGKELLYRVFDDMNYVGKMVTGDFAINHNEKLN